MTLSEPTKNKNSRGQSEIQKSFGHATKGVAVCVMERLKLSQEN
jgi:hypothetical protein